MAYWLLSVLYVGLTCLVARSRNPARRPAHCRCARHIHTHRDPAMRPAWNMTYALLPLELSAARPPERISLTVSTILPT